MELRFLVADDEEVNRIVLRKYLHTYGQVDFAKDGKEVVDAWNQAKAENKPYDLILLDIMMPVMDGQEALDLIRTQEHTEGLHTGQQVKVAMVTSLTDWDNALRSFKKGVEEYVTKPIDRTKILTLLESLKLI